MIGPDKGGRVKGTGFGVTEKLYFTNGRKPRHSKENDELRENLKAKEKELESTKNAYQRLTDNLLSQGHDIAKIVGNSISKSGGESRDAGPSNASNPSKNNIDQESVKQLPKKHGKSGPQKSSESIKGSAKRDSPCTKMPTISTESPVSLVSKKKSMSPPSTGNLRMRHLKKLPLMAYDANFGLE